MPMSRAASGHPKRLLAVQSVQSGLMQESKKFAGGRKLAGGRKYAEGRKFAGEESSQEEESSHMQNANCLEAALARLRRRSSKA